MKRNIFTLIKSVKFGIIINGYLLGTYFYCSYIFIISNYDTRERNIKI